MDLFFTEKGTDLIRAIVKQPLLLEYDPEKTKKVNAWLDDFCRCNNIWKHFRYEVYMDWDAIIMICDKASTNSLYMYADGKYWWVMMS